MIAVPTVSSMLVVIGLTLLAVVVVTGAIGALLLRPAPAAVRAQQPARPATVPAQRDSSRKPAHV